MAKIQNDRNRALSLIVVVLRIMKGRHQHFENLFGDSRRLFRVLLSIAVVLRKEDAKVWRFRRFVRRFVFYFINQPAKISWLMYEVKNFYLTFFRLQY